MATATSARAAAEPGHPALTGEELVPTRWSLLERLKDWEDQESWHQFYVIYSPLIQKAALRSGLTEPEAQEVVQETVLSVSRNMRTFQADPKRGAFKNWLLTLTQWRIIDQLRRRKLHEEHRQHRRGVGDGPKAATTGTSTEERIADPQGNALEALWQEEWDQTVTQAALERLKRVISARQFQIFYLHVIKTQDAATVTAILKVSRTQVYLAKHRVGRLFRQILRELEQTYS